MSDKSYISNGLLHYVVDEEYFKTNGYHYEDQEIIGIKYFSKKIAQNLISIRVENKTICVGDWDIFTTTIINYFLKYRNSEDVKYSKLFDFHYLSLRLNRKTGEIVNNTLDMSMDDDNIYNDLPWYELVLPIELTNEIIDEVNKLTNNKFKEIQRNSMKKYHLVNKATNETHLCVKHTVGDFDYYLDSENLNMKEIATNNPTSDLPKIINEVEELSNEYFNINRGAYTMGIDSAFEAGYYAAEEKTPFSKEDMINFGQYCIRSFALCRNHDSDYSSRIITDWEETHKVETIYFLK